MRPAEFFALITPTEGMSRAYVELVIAMAPGELRQSIYVAHDDLARADAVVEWADSKAYEVYFGPILRQQRGRVRHDLPETPFGPYRKRDGGKGVVERTAVLWLDIDPPESCDLELWRQQMLDALRTLPVRPTVIVLSGRGLHCYWKIRGSWDDYPDVAVAAAINRRLEIGRAHV